MAQFKRKRKENIYGWGNDHTMKMKYYWSSFLLNVHNFIKSNIIDVFEGCKNVNQRSKSEKENQISDSKQNWIFIS